MTVEDLRKILSPYPGSTNVAILVWEDGKHGHYYQTLEDAIPEVQDEGGGCIRIHIEGGY